MEQFCDDMVARLGLPAVQPLQDLVPHHGVAGPGPALALQEHTDLVPAQLAALPLVDGLDTEGGQGAAGEEELGVLAGEGGEAGGGPAGGQGS